MPPRNAKGGPQGPKAPRPPEDESREREYDEEQADDADEEKARVAGEKLDVEVRDRVHHPGVGRPRAEDAAAVGIDVHLPVVLCEPDGEGGGLVERHLEEARWGLGVGRPHGLHHPVQ